MRILSIDPGSVSAAWGFHAGPNGSLTDIEEAACGDVAIAGREIDVTTFLALIDEKQPTLAIIERAQAFPRQGASSAFNYGAGYGTLRACLAARAIPCEIVSAALWKRGMGLDDTAETSRAMALRLYPALGGDLRRKKDHNRAEALLLGRWAVMRFGAGAATKTSRPAQAKSRLTPSDSVLLLQT